MIPAVPNSGNKNCCMINSLHMLFQFHGENIPLSRFIPLTAYTFGFFYSNNGKLILGWPFGCPCLDAMTFISKQLGYDFEVIKGDIWKTVWEEVREWLDNGIPVLVGPLPIRIYSYNPRVPQTSWDSMCVICGYDRSKKIVFINDTFGLSYVPIQINDLELSWSEGKQLCPVLPEVPFFLVAKKKVMAYKESDLIKNMLKRASQQIEGRKISETLYTGIIAERKLANDIGSHFNTSNKRVLVAILSLLRNVTFFCGNQAKSDIACLLSDYTYKLPPEVDRKKILKLEEVYEEESSVYLEALGISGHLIGELQKDVKIVNASFFNILQEKMETLVNLEEKAKNLLQVIVEETSRIPKK